MSFQAKIAKSTRHFYHGGRVVLTLLTEQPEGDLPVVCHLRALTEQLSDYAERRYLPLATAALEQAAQSGELHRFFPYRYAVNCRFFSETDALQATLSVSVTAGDEQLFFYRLITRWSVDGHLQRSVPLSKRKIRNIRARTLAK